VIEEAPGHAHAPATMRGLRKAHRPAPSVKGAKGKPSARPARLRPTAGLARRKR
jgi:hypothetical protein